MNRKIYATVWLIGLLRRRANTKLIRSMITAYGRPTFKQAQNKFLLNCGKSLPSHPRFPLECGAMCARKSLAYFLLFRHVMNSEAQDRSEWPYSALLPYSMKAFPIVQLAPPIGAQKPASWPPPMDPEVAEWKYETASWPNSGNQIYLHVPFCPHLCGFCPLYKVKGRSQEEKELFIEAIIREIEMYGRSPAVASQQFNTVYIGGGTGSELSPAQMSRIFQALRRNFTITADAEITLEGVAKQMAQPGFMAESLEYGTNRISFGVESLEPKLRKEIGRGDPVAAYESLVRICRDLDPEMMLNAETMAALPGQTLESVEADVRGMLSWGLNSADVFYYVMMAGTKLQRLVSTGRRAEPGYGAEMLATRELVTEIFDQHGYHPITGEVFSKSDRDLFTTTSFGGGGNCLNTVLALGPSGFGNVAGSVYQNVCDLKRYASDLSEGLFPVQNASHLTLSVAKRRAKILALLRLHVPDNLFSGWQDRRRTQRWKTMGLLDRTSDGYKLSRRGVLWYNHMQMELLPISSLVKAAGTMFGSVEADKLLEPAENTQSYELARLFSGYGTAGTLAFKAFMAARKLKLIDQRTIGFTGAVEGA